MATSKVRIWQITDPNTYTVDSADNGTSTFTLAGGEGDVTSFFVEDVVFDITTGTNQGTYTVVSSTFGAATVITVSESVTTTAADATLALYEYIDFTFGPMATPQYTKPGKRIKNRLGIVRRITPPGATSLKRFVTLLTVSFLTTNMLTATSLLNRLENFLFTKSIDADEEYIVFMHKTSVDTNGTTDTTKRAYVCKLEDIPPWVYDTGAIIDGEVQDRVELPMLCTSDGVFSDFDDNTSGTYRSRS